MPTTDKTLTFTVTGTGSQTVLGISGDRFTINGTPTFLLGISYFQALNWRTSDIDFIQSKGFNWVRIFLEHWDLQSMASLQSNGVFSGSATIQSLCDYCDARGIIVEVVIFQEVAPFSSAPLPAIANVTAALASKGNIFYDVRNEHNLGGTMSHPTLTEWVTAVHSGDPGSKVTTSTARGHVGCVNAGCTTVITADVDTDLATGLDFIAPHFDRGITWDEVTDDRVTNLKNHLISVGRNIPILLSEEARRGEGNDAACTQADFETAVTNSVASGAAGWLLHTDANFDLRTQSMVQQLDSVELATMNTLAGLVAGPDDWATRSTAAGVFQAHQLDTQAIIDDWRFPDSQGSYMTLDTTIKPAASAGGSLRFQILNTDGYGSGQFCVPFNLSPGRGPGTTTYYQFLVRFEPDEVYAPYAPADYAEGTKICILSRDGNGPQYNGSNQLNEIVLQINRNDGELSGYNRDPGGNYPPWDEAFSSACPNSSYRTRYAASYISSRPALTGTNPDNGAAWTACEQVANQNGWIYGRYSGGTAAPDIRPGYGDPIGGGFRLNPRAWMCLEMRVIINQFNSSAGNRITVWGAEQGQAPKLLFDLQDQPVGNGVVDGGGSTYYNGLNLLPYTTYREPGGRKVSARSNAIPGIEIWNVGTLTPLGNGTLEYTASTGRIRFAAAGESFGVAHGFSAPNNILVRNVISSVGGVEQFRSFLQVKATTASLPTSGVHTETVTIANGRPDTQRHYARVICSSNPINFPGGHVLVLP